MTRPDAPIARSLDTIRAELDEIDERIHALIVRRAGLAEEVRRAKTDTGAAALRPAREAQMLRHLAGLNRGAMELGQVWRLWRELIMANARLQFPFVVDTVAASHDHELWDLGRAHFCFETAMEAHDDALGALGRATAEPARVALLRTADQRWWGELAKPGTSMRIFNALPMIAEHPGEAPAAMVIGDVDPGVSGDDVTVFLVRCTNSGDDAVAAASATRDDGIAYMLPGDKEVLIGWRGAHDAPPAALSRVLGDDTESSVVGMHAAPITDGLGRADD